MTRAGRVLRPGGLFAFTTRTPAGARLEDRYERKTVSGLDIFDHSYGYVDGLLAANGFQPLRRLRCFVGEQPHDVRVTHLGG